MNEILKAIAKKLCSGRWILTVVSAFTFMYAVRHKILDPAAISSILTAVFMSYFSKEKHDGTNNDIGNGR